jgi:phosphoribosylformimino-5-aminoimidazole carboxamide ribotide isomerase
MIFFPAIDIKDGKCVRLIQGDMKQVTVFNDDPSAQALKFADLGASWIHLVDLNGAFSGAPKNAEVVQDIINVLNIPIQLGGGIRSKKTIDFWLDQGIRRVILGTIALKNPDIVRNACKDHPGRIVVGIDARDGYVAVEGWTESSQITAIELGRKFEDCGVSAIVHTDIARDGAMYGPNIKATIELAKEITIPVIASGGVASMSDLKKLKIAGEGLLEGVISGRAIYDGQIDLRHAIRFLAA